MSNSYIDLSEKSELSKDFNIDDGWRFGMIRTARFADLDALAHLNHTTYLRYFEDCRLQYLIKHGLTTIQKCSPKHPSPFLLGLEIKYLKPVNHCDKLLITTRCIKIGNTSMTLEYSAWTNGCAAWCVGAFVFVIPDTGDKWTIDKNLKDSILKYELKTVSI
ncbi:MAG: hypothetical protein CMM30_06650 [Rhodospirillaceae bacterium]|nr:hypothetical protein [Rhodospirillaceae bacterium]|tara:strand:- start:2385 stop:2870 length:486 start_codon:yes stop_codon:yes gene_type:complete